LKYLIATMLIAALRLCSGQALAPPVWAHEGEDHGAQATPASVGEIAPRATAQTEEFELVAVLEGGQLSLSLDRFATNEPVADAQVEVESGAFRAVATQVAPGLYALSGDSFTHPGRYPLLIEVEVGDSADLLTTTLAVAAATTDVTPAPPWREWALWGGPVALLLAVTGLVAMRRRTPEQMPGGMAP
jgi:hypothetical protein